LFTIDDTSESLDKLKASVTDLDRAVGDYRKRFLLSPGAAPVDQQNVGRKLFDMVLGPAAKRLVGKKKLIIIPHGRLSTLPFESLVTPEGKFVVQDYDVVYSVSATVSAALDKKKSKSTPGARKAFVGMGDPVYDWAAFQSNQPEGTKLAASRALELWSAAEDSGSGGSPGLSRLPGTARELSAIAKLFGADQKVYLRAHANEGAAKGGGLSGYRLVHIASHGLLGAHYNALALTLNPNDDDDGFLINSEIADLKLDADLVVLSACRTGETKQQKAGEALAGLTLSLRSAGAGQVVLSLWSVDDDATSDLMVKLYKPLVDPSADVGHSLAEAKRKMIAEGKWAQPFYWAAFVLHGS
jgi:CHAT domain-containing protein